MTTVDDIQGPATDALALLPVTVFAFDAQGVCTMALGGGLDKMGVPQHAYVGSNLLDEFADMPEVVRAICDTLDGQEAATAATGLDSTWELRLRPVTAADGAVTGGVGIVLDVSDRTTIAASLAQNRLDAEQLLRAVPDQLVWLDALGHVLASKSARGGYDDIRMLHAAVGSMVDDVFDERLVTQLRASMHEALERNETCTFDYQVTDRADGSERYFEARVVPGRGETVLLMLRDVSKRQRLEDELQHAQRLEAIGRLAGGIAHEINTPIQFIGDNVRFLQKSFITTVELLDAYRTCLFGEADLSRDERIAVAEAAERAADVSFLTEEVPAAAIETLDGVERVATIVKAMKAVGRPSQIAQSPANINAGLESTLVVSRSEYKHLAHIALELGEIPPVICHIGELDQVFLNLIVNAAHAIADKVAITGERGRIGIRTAVDGEHVLVEISDDGCGIPDEIRRRIFEPFFTTKEVGRGTGQGLSLSRSLIVDRHGGTISVDSTPGEGTTFTIRLPVAGLAASNRGGQSVG